MNRAAVNVLLLSRRHLLTAQQGSSVFDHIEMTAPGLGATNTIEIGEGWVALEPW